MTTKPSTDGLSFSLDCYGTPVRVIMRDECPWFEALPLCAAMAVDWQAFVRFAALALDTEVRSVPYELEPLPAFSPIGHYEFVKSLHAPELSKFAAWTRKKAVEMVPEPDPDDTRMCLVLEPDGTRPAEPNRYTGRHYEWKELKFRPGYRPGLSGAGVVAAARNSAEQTVPNMDAFITRLHQSAAERNAAHGATR